MLYLGIYIWITRSGTTWAKRRDTNQLPDAIGPTTLQRSSGITLKIKVEKLK